MLGSWTDDSDWDRLGRTHATIHASSRALAHHSDSLTGESEWNDDPLVVQRSELSRTVHGDRWQRDHAEIISTSSTYRNNGFLKWNPYNNLSRPSSLVGDGIPYDCSCHSPLSNYTAALFQEYSLTEYVISYPPLLPLMLLIASGHLILHSNAQRIGRRFTENPWTAYTARRGRIFRYGPECSLNC
ncbi:uncharacterized protein ARMOST_19483 [Armillaria ostoyae]|uniref:Uncharacterized protein n=1 Tax=Armillaria ostoyae TaxID=47428 RepID=A0A284S4P3_ARMOS|nr:uncharacterized protein ARMOST_19483 [Armillaria ostoyae]